MSLFPRLATTISLLALAAGCRVAAPDAPVASPTLPAEFIHPTEPQPTAVAANANAAGPVAAAKPAIVDTLGAGALPWRQFFQDAALVGLIDTALRQNLDLRVAMQRVEVARAELLERRGALFPTVTATGSAGADHYGKYTMTGVGNFDTNLSQNIEGRQRVPTSLTPDFFAGLRSSWEIDLWGKLRSRRKAAYNRLLASEQGRNLVITNVVAEVARSYYELLKLDNQLAVLRRNIALQRKALELTRIQKEAGRATELAVQQFEAQSLRTESLAFETSQRITETENSLNQLLGRYPRPIGRGPALPQQALPARLGAGVPATALLHRPDVRQAELELQATHADISAARAAFLPSLTLTPYVGFNSFTSSLLFSPSSVVYGALAGLSGPILNRAVVRADYRRAVAGNLESYYDYQKTLQTGFVEVVNGLKGLDNFRAAATLRQREVDVLTLGVSTANDLYLAGYASYLEVITAQRSVLEAELNLAEARQAQLLQSVNLYRALGGGWDAQ